MARTIAWQGLGAASAVATKLMLREQPCNVVYCATGAEHPDNERFRRDLERWYGQEIEVIKSGTYDDTWDVWTSKRYISGIRGAPCTVALKVEPRILYQRPDDTHVLGYTADALDVARAKRLREHFFEIDLRTPLIERGITKASCQAILEGAGIELPVMYRLGFLNNNCIPCGKATSPAYWALIRRHFPAQFDRMAALARELGVRLCRIGVQRAFIDDIPSDQPTTDPISPSCDFLCALAAQDLEENPLQVTK